MKIVVVNIVLFVIVLLAGSGFAALATQPLVAYWNLNQASLAAFTVISGSCSPASDVTLAAFTSSAGASVGTSGGVPGFGNYLSLPGSNPAAALSSFLLPTSAISISFRFNVAHTATNKAANLISKGSLFSITLQSSGNKLVLSASFTTSPSGTVYSMSTTSAVLASTWYTATFSYSGSSATLYLNNEAANPTSSPSGAFSLDGSSFALGCNTASGCYPSAIDELRVYSQALTAADVAVIVAATSGPTQLVITSPTPSQNFFSNPVADLSVSSTITGAFSTASYLWEVISGSCSSIQILTPSAAGTAIDLLDVGVLQLRLTVQDTLTCKRVDFNVNSSSVLPSYSGATPGPISINANTFFEVPLTVTGFPVPTVTWEYATTTNQTVVLGNDTVTQLVTSFVPFAVGAPLQLIVNPRGEQARAVTNFNGTFNNSVVHAVISNGINAPTLVGNWTFTVLAAAPTNTTSGTPTGNATPGSSSSSDIGAIVGAVVGGGGGLLLLLALLCCCFCCCFCLVFIVVIIVVAAVLIVLVVAVIAVGGLGVAGISTPVTVMLMRRRKGFKLVPPDFSLYAFGGFVREDFYKEPAAKKDVKRAGKMHPLFQSNSVLLAQAVCQVSPVSDLDKVCPAIVFTCFPAGSSFETVSTRVAKELVDQKLGTLFRSNEAATKLFSAWAKAVGIRYLWDLFAMPIHELGSSLGEFDEEEKSGDSASNTNTAVLGQTNLELDPTKLGADFDAQDLEVNVLELQLILQKLLNFICNRVGAIPSPIVHFLKFFNEELRKKYDSEGLEYGDAQMSAGLGSFFFLRFVCPAVTNPHVYGIMKAPPSEGMHRQLIMIGKVLQNLSNNTLPGNKEEYMSAVNNFIERNQPRLHKFYRAMMQQSSDDAVDVDVPATVMENAKRALDSAFVSKLVKVMEVLGYDNDAAMKLQEIYIDSQ